MTTGSNELKTVYINGEHIAVENASISVFDSGFNFGDGVFEGMRVYDGRVLFLPEHIRRLYESASAIFLEIPIRPEQMCEDILSWLRANEINDDFHFRPIVSRGPRRPPRVDPRFAASGPTIVFVGAPIDSTTTRQGIRVVVSRFRRYSPDSLDSKIKSLSYLSSVLPKLDALNHGADDAVVLDGQGLVAEGSTSNLFIVRRGRLLTPWPRSNLEGITRQRVIEIAAELELPFAERDLTTTDLHAADEMFLCGTGAEITPVVSFEGTVVGDGNPGSVTSAVAARYLATLADFGTSIEPVR